MHSSEKTFFMHMKTTKSLISRHVSADWLAALLFAIEKSGFLKIHSSKSEDASHFSKSIWKLDHTKLPLHQLQSNMSVKTTHKT